MVAARYVFAASLVGTEGSARGVVEKVRKAVESWRLGNVEDMLDGWEIMVRLARRNGNKMRWAGGLDR